MRYEKEAPAYNREPRPGKIEVVPLHPCRTQSDLSLACSLGVAVPCLEIKKNPGPGGRHGLIFRGGRPIFPSTGKGRPHRRPHRHPSPRR